MNMNKEELTGRKLFIAEVCGTGLLLLVGLSSVIFMFADGSPFVALIPSLTLRRVLNGFLFGSLGASIALSPLGMTSGTHLNPIVTMGFWLFNRSETIWITAIKFTRQKLAIRRNEDESDRRARRQQRNGPGQVAEELFLNVSPA